MWVRFEILGMRSEDAGNKRGTSTVIYSRWHIKPCVTPHTYTNMSSLVYYCSSYTASHVVRWEHSQTKKLGTDNKLTVQRIKGKVGWEEGRNLCYILLSNSCMYYYFFFLKENVYQHFSVGFLFILLVI